MTRDEQIEAVLSRLKLPSPQDLESFGYIAKLVDNPGSIIFLAIEEPLAEDGPRVGKGWFSAAEREGLRKALKKVNEKRSKSGEPPTTEPPNAASQRNQPEGQSATISAK